MLLPKAFVFHKLILKTFNSNKCWSCGLNKINPKQKVFFFLNTIVPGLKHIVYPPHSPKQVF